MTTKAKDNKENLLFQFREAIDKATGTVPDKKERRLLSSNLLTANTHEPAKSPHNDHSDGHCDVPIRIKI